VPVPWSESLPQFSLAGTLLTVLLLFFAAFGEPLLGRRAFAWLSRRENGDERALGLLYAVTMAIHVLWGLLILAVLLLSPELNLVDLGLRVPDAFGPIVGAAIGGAVALAAFWVLVNGLPTRGRKGHRGRRSAPKPMTLPEPGRRQYLLLPRTGRERALAARMAVTGGVFGELLYRGLFITLVASMGAPLWIAAVLSVLLFSLAHAYQGWWGLLSAGFSGTLFTVLYLGTGSLVVPVLVHVALNLRSVVFPPASEREAAEEALRLDDYYDDEYDDEDELDDEPQEEPVRRKRRNAENYDDLYEGAPATPPSKLRGVITIYTLADGQGGGFDQLANAVVAEVSKREPDTLLFASHTVPSAPLQRIVYAIYRDELAQSEHEQQPHVMEFTRRLSGHVVATNVIELSLSGAAATDGLAALLMPR
ncbi:CPBP family intramembrane glutamic endopeptidase, partial [Streptomyces sp. NPDC000931]|uniref:CPBP family intramembrane glutamic endopeptidase n=1 Tax=Streptomyces sp. NPDC000931 TaxID=3154372 RepID=UPI003319D854